jgi:hypothetical protein
VSSSIFYFNNFREKDWNKKSSLWRGIQIKDNTCHGPIGHLISCIRIFQTCNESSHQLFVLFVTNVKKYYYHFFPVTDFSAYHLQYKARYIFSRTECRVWKQYPTIVQINTEKHDTLTSKIKHRIQCITGNVNSSRRKIKGFWSSGSIC